MVKEPEISIILAANLCPTKNPRPKPREFDKHLQKRILVTGSAGFIGSFLREAMLARGDEVLCFDNFYTGT
jgi:FlaA1/EpsC-like NDP-sugar epimerase